MNRAKTQGTQHAPSTASYGYLQFVIPMTDPRFAMLHGELGVSVSSWTPQRRTVAIGRHYTRMVPTGSRRLMCPHFLALRVLHVNHRMCCKCEVSCATSSHSQRVNNCRQGCPVMGEVVQKHPASHKVRLKLLPNIVSASPMRGKG